jgi:DNA-binding FrmR family transcriptional regulator
MAHTTHDKTKLLNRVRRIRGQVEAIERALTDDRECSDVLNTIAACRGAMNSLMAELVEGHMSRQRRTSPSSQRARSNWPAC